MSMSDSEEPLEEIDGGDDLFGDEGDDDLPTTSKVRDLDDDDLASDPSDDGRGRRGAYEDEDPHPHETRDRVVMATQTYRHQIPNPKDGTLAVMRVPKFIKFLPELYDSSNFVPSEFDISNAKSERHIHVARVCKDESTGLLHSNTNIFRWSDGSLTISVGGEHYEIQKKSLAPAPGKPYNELHDGHYYAAAAELSSNLLMTVGHLTEQFNVRPNKAGGDDALAALAERMAQASKSGKDGDNIIRTTRDPELQKKQAEMAEKERMKAQRRRENAALKMDGGLGPRSGRGGLSIGDLEGGRGHGSGRKRIASGALKLKRRRPEYDSDDDLPQGVGRREDYDMDDGFLVGSEDEDMESEANDDEEEEELLEDEEEERRPARKKRQKTTEVDDDEDAEGEDSNAAEPSSRSRRRHVLEDDDE
ncbi:hypothetical protein E4U61_000768 [Claviceps capensis]|nr:hypothetical protein E4U61_000768 [Claviceps capensis]